VQTYHRENPGMATAKYALHLEFAQMVVWEQEANELQLHFKKLALLPESAASKLQPQLRVTACHGTSWSGQPVSSQQALHLNQNMTLYFQSLLDAVELQVLSGSQKLCEAKLYVFELLGLDYRACDLVGDKVRGQLKVKATTFLPIIVVD
jgi:hypothetical protein